MGFPWAVHLREAGVRIIDFNFSAASKAHLVQHLQRVLEQESMHMAPNEVVRNELREFRTQGETLGGIVRYGPPTGYHDDCVISLALCAWALKEDAGSHSIGPRSVSYMGKRKERRRSRRHAHAV